MKQQKKWWEEKNGFFGDFYIEGDNSLEGYLQEKNQTLTERTTTEVNGIIKLLNLQRHEKVLDIPCGYGRHTIELAKQKYEVLGCDINSTHLKKAKENTNSQNVHVNFKKLNMIDLSYKNEFDAVINMFYSFGFFEKDEENKKVLINFYNSLKKGGRFLMHTDVNIPRIINGKYKENEIRNLVDGKKLHIIDKYNHKNKRIEGTWIIKQPNNKDIRRDYSVRVYTKDEFVSMCKEVGFSKINVYSDWEYSNYSEDSEDMMVVAIK